MNILDFMDRDNIAFLTLCVRTSAKLSLSLLDPKARLEGSLSSSGSRTRICISHPGIGELSMPTLTTANASIACSTLPYQYSAPVPTSFYNLH